MQNVLADLAVESEAATIAALRLARAYDEAIAGDEQAQALKRIGNFEAPVYVAGAPGFRDLLFVVEQPGKVIVTRNGRRLSQFKRQATRHWRKWLDRTSQNAKKTWAWMNRYLCRCPLPPVTGEALPVLLVHTSFQCTTMMARFML